MCWLQSWGTYRLRLFQYLIRRLIVKSRKGSMLLVDKIIRLLSNLIIVSATIPPWCQPNIKCVWYINHQSRHCISACNHEIRRLYDTGPMCTYALPCNLTGKLGPEYIDRKNACRLLVSLCKYHFVYIYIYIFVVVNFDALAQASDIEIERRQVVFLCWRQDLNPRPQTPNRQQTECSLTNRLSYRGSS